MNKNNKIIKSFGFYMLSAFGISLTIKANIGVSSFTAMNIAFSDVLTIPIGTVTIFFNIMFLIVYMIQTKFQLKKKYIIQILCVLMFGVFINFFTYSLLGSINIKSYLIKILMITTGTIIAGMSVGMIVSYNTITFPIESVCLTLSENTNLSFMVLRYAVDLFSICISIIISLSYTLPLYVREGTVISLLLLSASMNLIKNIYKKVEREFYYEK